MNWAEILHKQGLRCTPGRVALLSVLHTARRPQSLQELLKQLPAKTDRVTVYRSLEQFIEKNLVRPVHLGGSTRYELRDEHDHHHVVCTCCGKTQDIDLCAMKQLESAITSAATSFSAITDHSFEVFGLCKRCTR
jgi:Fe2+ or Zn2+ uptake regulation protein